MPILESVQREGNEKEIPVTIKHKVSSSSKIEKGDEVSFKNIEEAADFLGEGMVVGGTSWLWADDKMEDSVDYLFVDEAGQMACVGIWKCQNKYD